jgi:hypothetical protein
VSGTDSNAQPPAERQSNRTRRYQPKKSPRAKFPLITSNTREEMRAMGMPQLLQADLDVSDPTAGGGRGFKYQWEDEAATLHDEIQSVAAGGGISYTHHQSVPAATWVIDHHLGLIPNVVLLDDNGQMMMAEVQFPSDQTVLVVHSAPYSGTAYLRP